MASIISAGTTSGTSLNLSGDTSGVLQLATNGSTTAVTITTAQNVGIGTASPAYALDVRSTAAPAIRLSRSGTAGQIASMVFEDGNAALGSGSTTRIASDSGAMSFSTGGTSGAITGGTERMRIASGGEVLVGTTSSSYYKSNFVVNSASSTGISIIDTSTTLAMIAFGYTTGTTIGGGSNRGKFWYDLANDSFNWNTAGTGSLTPNMRIDSSGNVGIGTSSPDGKLKVVASGANLIIGFSGTQNYFDASENIFRNFAGTERMRITSGGLLLIGTTSGTPNPGFSFDPNGTLSIGNNAAASGFEFQTYRRSGVQIGSVYQNGTTAVLYNTTSDYRLKENIAPMTGALATVAQLKPCTYTWKVDGSAGQGFIAHELQAVVPDCVAGEKDAVETYIDEEGNEQTRIKPQGIDTSFLVATLTAAIQEQQAMIETLQAEVAALKGVN